MIEQNLKIYINGPDPKDTKIFIGNYRVSLLKKFSLNINSEYFLPRIDMSFPAINLTYQGQLPLPSKAGAC